MQEAAVNTSNILVEDLSCPRPDGSTMLIRVARPKGAGPFPAIVDIHGGGWVMGDRKQNAVIDDALAARGIVVAAPEFRMPPAGKYPLSITDIHLSIRWLKANAARLGSRADLVGGLGTSSGGHQLLLCALKPDDTRYAVLPLAGPPSVDARLPYVALGWPVADPLARFHMATAKQIKTLVEAHAAYWPGEAAMAEGNPQKIVEQRTFANLPPILVLQGTNDDNLGPDMADNFVNAYRAAGGDATLHKYEGMPHTFVTRTPDAPESKDAIERLAAFIKARAKV
jgi:acetyl esterase/lipase